MTYESPSQPPYGGGEPPYGSPPPGAGSPGGSYGGPPPGTAPNNNLVWAILSTIFCCLPLGIVSIVYAAQVNSKWALGDVVGARESAEKAKQFAIWSAVGFFVAAIGYAALLALGVATTGYSAN